MKTYAKQIDPEFQESMLFFISRSGEWCWENECYDNVCVLPRKGYHDYMPEDIRELFDMFNRGELDTETLQELCNRELSEEEKQKLSELLSMYDHATWSRDLDNLLLLAAVSVLRQTPYKLCTIHGCCQSEWREILYPSEEFTDDDVRIFETLFFNTGTEWIVHDGETDPNSPEDIDGFSIYCTDPDENATRAAIADVAGCNPEDVILYEFAGYTKAPKYKMI